MPASRGIISVFGGARVERGSEAYEQARLMGELLGRAGFSVSTGGYGGVMGGASEGAASAGAHVIGVTTNHFSQGEERHGVNQWVTEERRFLFFRERLMHTIDVCDAAIAMGGGVGTLVEVSLMWNIGIVGEDRPRPIIMVGKFWKDTFDAFLSGGDYVRTKALDVLHFVDTPQQAVDILEKAFPR